MAENERFTKAVSWLKNNRLVFNNADLSAILQVSQTYVSLLNSGKKPLTEKLVKNLVTKFPTLNADWLLRGEGTMLKVDATGERPLHYPESGETPEQAYERIGVELDELKKELDKVRAENADYKEQLKVLTKALDLAIQARDLNGGDKD